MYQSLTVVADFFDHPHEVRAQALRGEHPEGDGLRSFPGGNSRQLFGRPASTKSCRA